MRKILISILTIGVVGAAAFMGSRAFFSDSQTSKDNTFLAGELKLKIDSTQHYDGLICKDVGTVAPDFQWQREDPNVPSSREDLVGKPCTGTWPLRSLTSEKFFNFADIKPGDWGENTISMHIVNNDAWACVDVSPLTVTTDADRALAAGLNFFAWNDKNCDNTFQPQNGEVKLFSNTVGPASDVLNGKTYTLADSLTGKPILGGPLEDVSKTQCIGLSWCAGTLTVNPETGATICDGAALGNNAQGGKVQGDITFRVEQSRNNPNFVCTNNNRVFDFLNIGDTTSETGHNLLGWSNNQTGVPYDGTNYGGGSSDKSFRLLMGPGDSPVCDPSTVPATFTMNAGLNNATKLTLEHLDGQVNDSFDLFINNVFSNHYTAGSLGTETWKVTTFNIPSSTGVVNVKLVVTNEVNSWCNTYGQVAFSNATLTN